MNQIISDFEMIVNNLSISNNINDSKNNMLKLFKLIDLDFFTENPEIIFKLHRILAKRPELLDISIRFTVQVNLFSGSIINFGHQHHLNILKTRPIGCFALTEKYAGVFSGMIVNTSFKYQSNTFIFNTLESKDRKNWISQGLTSEYCVLFAKGTYKNNKNTIFPFLIKLTNQDGCVHDTINISNMGTKSVANYLDNAEISFNNHVVSEDCIMDNFKKDNINFMDIANRLLVGRVILAQCCLIGCKQIYDNTQIYLNNKPIPNSIYKLYNLPVIQEIFKNFYIKFNKLNVYCREIEIQLCNFIKNNDNHYDNKLIKKINVAKIACTEFVCKAISDLQINVGSVLLLKTHSNLDAFLTFRFAEGDTNILRQKIVNDEIMKIKNNSLVNIFNPYKLINKHQLYKILFGLYFYKPSEYINYMISNQLIIKQISDEIIDFEINHTIKSKL